MAIVLFVVSFIIVYVMMELFFAEKEGLSLVSQEELKADKNKTSAFRNILRGLTPLTQNLAKKTGFAVISRKLVMAGSPLNVPEFLAFEILTTLSIPIIAALFLKPAPVLLGVLFLVGFLIPIFWLQDKIRRRHFQIARDLPNIIDLLNLCVGAGMDFMLAVQRVIREFKKCPLLEELSEVLRENQMGLSRREALKNMAWRVNMAEIHSFVRTLIQADRMGSPLSEALNIQAEEIRIRRFQRGESQALKAPIKMLLPLIVFILPIILVIVGGPIVLQFVKGGGLKF